MRTLNLPVYLFVIFALLYSTLSHAVEATAIGLAAIVDGDIPTARQQAIDDAKRRAAEELLGSFIKAHSQTQNFMLASEKIYSSTAGRLDQVKILKEEATQDGLYRVQIRATAGGTDLAKNSLTLLKDNNWNTKPRIKFKKTVVDDSSMSKKTLAQGFISRISNKLAGQGFSVLEEDSPLYAHYILYSNLGTQTLESDFQGVSINTNQANASYRLINAATGEAVSSLSLSEKKAGNPAKAFNDIVRKMADRTAQKVLIDTKVAWMQHHESPIIFSIDGLTQTDVAALETNLQTSVVGLSSIQVESKKDQDYVFSATYFGWPDQLFTQLEQLSQRDDFAFTVTDFQQARLVLAKK